MKSILVGIKNVLLWSYARGTWQYDALCLGIVLAVFLVPSRYFGDRDRVAHTNGIEYRASKTQGGTLGGTPGGTGAGAFETYIKADTLEEFLTEQNRTDLKQSPKEGIPVYLQDRLKKNVTIIDVKPFIAPDGKAIYQVWFK